jgi:hypothetical protein
MQLQKTPKFAVLPPFSQLFMPFLPQMSRSYVVFGKVVSLTLYNIHLRTFFL